MARGPREVNPATIGTTGGTAAVRGAGDAGAGPSDALPPGMDEASYQAMLQQARAWCLQRRVRVAAS